MTPLGASTTTGPNGHYSLTLPVDTYDVDRKCLRVCQSQTATGVAVTDGGTTVQDFALVAAAVTLVSAATLPTTRIRPTRSRTRR